MNLPVSPSIVVDSVDRAHVFWYQAFYDDCMYWLGDAVYYKTREAGAWIDRSTLLQGHVGGDTDIAIDWHGEPLLAWREDVSGASDIFAMFHIPSSSAHALPSASGLSMIAYPNPFRSSVAVRLDGGWSSGSALDVLDISGRLVARLEVPAAAGAPRILHWDGRATDGRVAPSGAYLLRAPASGGSGTLRIVRIE